MNKHFLLTNKTSGRGVNKDNFQFTLEGFDSNHSNIYIKGYVLPRISGNDINLKKQGRDLVSNLIEKFPDSWVNKIKGRFIIIILNQDSFTIVTDHLGLYPLYLKNNGHEISISDSFWALKPKKKDFNIRALESKALFHREVGNITIEKNIKKIQGGTIVRYRKQCLTTQKYWEPAELLKPINKKFNISFFTNLLKEQVQQVRDILQPNDYTITITGGKDSRTALAAMLNQKIKPKGFTYGNLYSKDAQYAKILAKKAHIEHFIITPPSDENWVRDMYIKLLNQEHPWINVHRAHRYYSFQEVNKYLVDETAYFAGYLGGELLMGIYYDDLIFSPYIKSQWENLEFDIKDIFESHFLKIEHTEDSAFDLIATNEKESKFIKQFHGLFEIGIPHHCQDITLSSKFFRYPIAFFLDIDFLFYIFQSKYGFQYVNNKTKNPFKRYKLFKFNLNIQHALASYLDDVPFAKKGSYSTREFRYGSIYWSFCKVFRYIFDRKKYPSTYHYKEAYKSFVKTILLEIKDDIEHPIHSIYKIDDAIKELESESDLSQEKVWHRYTNILMAYRHYNKFE